MASKRRIDVRAILADPDLRRRLMVPTIQATQAREGIETSTEQAERAYYVVTEGERAAFFDLARFGRTTSGDDSRAAMFEQALAEGSEGVRFDVARRDFAFLQDAVMAYASIRWLAPLFRALPALVPTWGVTRSGLNTTEIERFTRLRWEVQVPTSGRRWVSFAKGGAFSRFYSDLDLVLDWTNDGRDFKRVVAAKYGSASRFVKSEADYFKAGITWMQTTNLGINARVLPDTGVFGVASPAFFPDEPDDTPVILAIVNSAAFDALARCFATRNWGATAIGSLPVPAVPHSAAATLGCAASAIYGAKALWDEGNELSSRFRGPWLLREDLVDMTVPLAARLDTLALREAAEQAAIQQLYGEISEEVYRLYGFSHETRATIEETLGARPPEVLWPQMEGKTAEQKRMENVYRLLSHLVRVVVDADQDGIVPLLATAGEASLVARVHDELARVFPQLDAGQVEVDIANELKRAVRGYRRVSGIAEWLENVFFDYHCSLYKNRPILWHVASTQGVGSAAFGAVVHYHRFDADCMAKLRARYVKDALDTFRRETALAEKAGLTDERREWQAKADELAELDRRLQWVQEGRHEGPEGGDRDFRILTPWKPTHARPSGWDPDIDDGVKVNIAPLQKAAGLRRVKVV